MNKIWALEPRIMFDGAALVTGAEVVTDQNAQPSGTPDAFPSPTTIEPGDETASETSEEFASFNSTLATLSAPSVRKEIVFIDTRVADYQTLLSGIAPDVEAVLLDPTRNGIEQLADMLRDRSDLDAIHVISHGNQSELWLGTGHLTLNSMNGEHADELTVIGQALADTGDILIYGCNFGQGVAGQEAVDRLANLTGADVAASWDDTGSTGYGGDWDLEYQMGNIETQIALNAAMQQTWVGKLAVITVDTFADVIDATDGVTSLREAILQVNAGSGGDTIVLGSGTYTLSLGPSGDNNGNSGDLDILQSVTLTGAGAQTTIIDGNGLDRIFHIQNSSTVVTMSGLTIRGGLASDNGAGFFIDNSSTLNLSDATVTNNDGMGGRGGGFHVHGTLNLNRVLLANNTAAEGGGIYFHGAIGGTLTNVTVSGNNATNEGGGLWTEIPISIMNSTIAFNTASSGAGVVDKDGMEITITNSILHNPAGQNSKNVLMSGGNNIDSDGTAGLGDPLDGMDPLLSPLANNGGPTQTHALQPGSPAINAGTATGAPAVDQRGVLRDANVDIGAYEVSSNITPAVDLDADNSSGATGNDYTVTFTEGDGPINIADSDTNLTDADSTTFASVKLAVSGLLNGNDEELLLDGHTFSLATAVVGQDTSGGKYHVVMITGAGTATLTITRQGGGTFTEMESETLITSLQYLHRDANAPTDGTRLIDVIVNDGSSDTAAARTTINVISVNDAPSLVTNNPLPVPEESTRTITTVYLEATDVDNTATQLVYTLTQLPGGTGQVRLNGSALGLGGTFTQDDINNNRVTFTFTDEDESSVTNFKFTLSDGAFTSAEHSFSINGQPVNDPPTLNGLDHAPTFTEGGAAVVLDSNATIADPELDAANNYDGAILTLVRNGGSNVEDIFNGSGTLSTLVESGPLTVGGTNIGTVTTNSGGTLVLTFNSNATTALVNSVLQQITYANSSPTPPASVQVDFTINDGNTGNQGSGGALTATGAITVTITATNTAPTLDLDVDNSSGATGNAYAFTYTESDSPTAIADSDINLADLDNTTFTSVTLAISSLLDGNAETMVLDGDTFGLATAVASQNTSGGNYHVSLITGAGTAMVTITKQGGGTFSEIETETLIKAVHYQHTDANTPTDGNRLIDVTVNDGTTDSIAARTTITVNSVNDAPLVAANTGMTVNETSSGNIISTAMLNEGDPDDAGTGVTYTITAPTINGTLRLSGTALGLNDTFTQDDIDNNRLTYNHDGSETTTDTFSFSLADGGEDGASPATGIFTITVNSVNEPPAFSGLDHTPTFTEGGTAVVLDPDATIADPELDAANNYNGAILTLVRNGGGNPDDVFNGSGTLLPLVESGNIMVGVTTIGTVTTNSGGTLVLTFNNNATTTLVNSAFQQITYANNGSNPPASVQIDYTFSDGNAGGQGTGGALNDTGSITVSINAVNNSPVALPDSFVVNEESSNTLNLANNDLDMDDGLDVTSITIVADPANGTIDSVNPDGTVTYTHNGSETVSDSFTYTIRDLSGAGSNTVRVDLIVSPVNDAPVITSNGGGVSAHVSLTEGSTAVTQVVATDAEGDPLIHSISGGADAALFAIDPATGIVTFKTAPNAQTPADAGTDNVYDVVVQVSDGAAVATQALAVTVTSVPPAILNPPPPVTESSPASDPQPGESETDGGTETEIEEGSDSGVPFGNNSSGPVIESNHHSSDTPPKTPDIPASRDLNERDETSANSQGEDHEWLAVITETFGKLRGNMDLPPSAEEIRSLLNRQEFLDDLDHIRDAFKEFTATEQIYLASSAAAASGLSVGYVIWLLRSGVLLTALLSSVPAWQFVNPLLVLTRPAKHTDELDQNDPGDDSVESLFENPTEPADESKSPVRFMPHVRNIFRAWRNST